MAISQKIRFEVFKRDGFICKYCGKRPPDIMLEVDHIMPIAEGGKDDINNLITSCFNCNRGKGKILLETLPSSITENLKVVKEQQKQTREYYKLVESIEQQREEDIREIGYYFNNLFAKTKRTYNQYIFAGQWKSSIKTFLKIFNKYEIIEAIDISFGKFGFKGASNNEKDKTFRYMCGILHNWRRERYG